MPMPYDPNDPNAWMNPPQQPMPPTLGPGRGPGATMPPPQQQQPMPQAAPQAAPQAGAQGAVDPNVVQAMLSMNQLGPREQQMQRQQLLADKLRAQAPGMMKSSSSISTPNWAGALAGAIGGIKANQMDQAAAAEGTAIGGERKKAYGEFLRGLRGGSAGSAPGTGVPVSPEGWY